MSRRIVIAGLASGLACLVPLTALAQAAAAAASPASAVDNGEIARVIITAQKRKEDIRDVPVSVSVMSAEQLKASQINTVEDLTRNIPNISFSSQAGPGLGTVEIRGVSSQAGSATVAVYLDDVSLTTRNLYSQGTAEPRFFDIDNVEVLRGPQGTLYGASSLGGTIKFVSKQPDLKYLGGSASAEIYGTQHGSTSWQEEGVINVPIIKDKLAIRVGLQSGHQGGYIDQVNPDTGSLITRDINSSNWTVAKLSAKAVIEPGWSLTPALFVQQMNTDDIDAAYLTSQSGLTLGSFQTSKKVQEPGRDRLAIPSLTINGETNLGTFTAVLSGYQRRFNRIQDGTSINDPSYAVIFPPVDPENPNAPPPANLTKLVSDLDALTSQVQLSNKIDQTSLELRMASKDYDPKGRNPFTWIGGMYVSDATTQVYDNEPIPGVLAAFAANGVNPGDPTQLDGGFPGDFTGDSSYYSARHYHDKQASVFGELTYHPTDKIAATVGMRYLDASQHFTRQGALFYAGSGDHNAVIDSKATATTPSFKLSWMVDPATSLYANVSKGFRLGGANRPVPDTVLVEQAIHDLGLPSFPASSYAPDSLWNYEFGSKSSLWGNRVTLNLSAFLLKWKNIQQNITLGGSGFDFEANTGKAKSYGLEAELRARATENLTLMASAGLTHATFSEDIYQLGTDADGVFNVRKGDSLQGVPRGSLSLAFDYHWALTGDANAFVRGNGQWTGKSHGSLFRDDPDYNRPAYFTVDASTGVNFDKWEFTLFVKNLTGNHVAIQHPNIQNVNEAYYLRPRQIGVSGNYEF
jgi:outer membrane receptor protein involved in Fe transport